MLYLILYNNSDDVNDNSRDDCVNVGSDDNDIFNDVDGDNVAGGDDEDGGDNGSRDNRLCF